jgi:hypothetical protein
MIADSFVELGCVHPRHGDQKEGFEPRRHEEHEAIGFRARRAQDFFFVPFVSSW